MQSGFQLKKITRSPVFGATRFKEAQERPIFRALMGFKKKYDFIFEMDADLSHDPKELSPMLDYLKSALTWSLDRDMSKGLMWSIGL